MTAADVALGFWQLFWTFFGTITICGLLGILVMYVAARRRR